MTVQNNGKPFRLWMGDMYSIIISDPILIREIFVKNFNNFINRTDMPSIHLISSNYLSLSASSDEYWKNAKNVMTQGFTQSFKKMTKEITMDEIGKFIVALQPFAKSQESIQPRKYCQTLIMNIILRFVVGKSINYTECKQDRQLIDELIKPMEDVFAHLGGHHLGDFVGFLKPLYLFYLLNFHDPAENFKKYFDHQIRIHQETFDPDNIRDFLDVLLSNFHKLDNNLEIVRALAQDLLNAGTETTSTTLEWFFLSMANNIDIQEKAYNELKLIVGKENRLINVNDRQYTPYTNALIKEVMRRYPILPLGLLRKSKEEIQLSDGTLIPKDTIIFPNLHYSFTSERYWDQSKDFNPDRFLNNNHSEVFYPFGIGPRGCIGQAFAQDIEYISITNILLNFKITTTNGKTIDETELFSITVHPNIFSTTLESRY
ncbi:hypothetical protein CYY_006714 [Polysphondylium violaceum]|uniref:Cytochrome P450 family protein n=1 Tax=Polysphondylium violaceum TaxID=133409 RepID=A0A8J4PRH9_9MYCE|nr:hypothetical protein CYY_006714 [Polysphondylium violaceum]